MEYIGIFKESYAVFSGRAHRGNAVTKQPANEKLPISGQGGEKRPLV